MSSTSKYHCLICKNTFDYNSSFRFTCRCGEGHSICDDCGEDMSYTDGKNYFGISHYVDDKRSANDNSIDLMIAWNKKFDEVAYTEFNSIYEKSILPNGWVDFDFLTDNFKGYRGVSIPLLILFNISESQDHERIIYDPAKDSITWYRNSEYPIIKNTFAIHPSLILHKIKPDSDTILYLTDEKGDNTILTKNLRKGEECVLNLFFQLIPFSGQRYIRFDPEVDFEYIFLDYYGRPDEKKYIDQLPEKPTLSGLREYLTSESSLVFRTLCGGRSLLLKNLGLLCENGGLFNATYTD